MLSTKRLQELFTCYLRNDYDMADPAYVRNVLTDICHMTIDEAKEMGILDLFTDEHGNNPYIDSPPSS